MSHYQRADFAPLRDGKYGVGFHWTTWTAPQQGELTSFEDAVNAFDVDLFVEQVVACGAAHVLFPTCHINQHMPCPHPVIDSIIEGRTCKRDLIMDIANALEKHGIPMILYYNFGLHWDKDWVAKACPDRSNPGQYFQYTQDIIKTLGERYGKKVLAFWFDVGWNEFEGFPFEEMTKCAKAGNPERLVTYNTSIEVYKTYTEFQDFWSGEGVRLNYIPRSGDFGKCLTPQSGLPWYNFVDWHPDYMLEARCGEWGLQMHTRDLDWPAPDVQSVEDFLKRFTDIGGAVTFNLFVWRNGEIYAPDLAVMKQLKDRIRK